MTSTGTLSMDKRPTAPRNPTQDLGRLATPGVLMLAGILAVQLLLALAMSWTGRDIGDTAAGTPLIPYRAEQVTRIEITGSGQDPVRLERQSQGWILPALDGFPAAAYKVDELLGKLTELKQRLPVGTSDRALERFKVSDETHERRLAVHTADGESAELLFGDSPGFRRIFVRPAGGSAVYEVPLAVSDIAPNADDWTDKSILQLTTDSIQRIHFPDFDLTRGDEGWQLAGAPEPEQKQEQLDAEKADQLIRTLSSLSFSSVKTAPAEDPEDGREPESIMDFHLTLDNDEQLDHRIVKTADGEHILMLSSQPDRFFVISQYQADELLEQNRAGLLIAPPETTDASEPDQPAPPPPPAAPQDTADAPAGT